MPCQNGGICQSVGSNYNCGCTNEYFGSKCQLRILNSTIFNGSTILTNEQSVQLVNLTDFSLNSSWSLIYQASRDGFSSSVFHSKCDGNTGVLVLIKSSNSYIFGGYTQAAWSSYYSWHYDSNAFLFSLVNSYNYPVKMPVTNPQYAIYASSSIGPTFGEGHDLYISSDGTACYTNLGYSYFLTYGISVSQYFLSGSYSFKAVEIEVYKEY